MRLNPFRSKAQPRSRGSGMAPYPEVVACARRLFERDGMELEGPDDEDGWTVTGGLGSPYTFAGDDVYLFGANVLRVLAYEERKRLG